MDRQQFWDSLRPDLEKEARALRKTATKEQRANLDFETMNPYKSDRCIYGQMTGSCWSKEAGQLLAKCGIPFGDSLNVPKLFYIKSNKKFRAKAGAARAYSAIEVAIIKFPSFNAKLLAYLKGEKRTLYVPKWAPGKF